MGSVPVRSGDMPDRLPLQCLDGSKGHRRHALPERRDRRASADQRAAFGGRALVRP